MRMQPTLSPVDGAGELRNLGSIEHQVAWCRKRDYHWAVPGFLGVSLGIIAGYYSFTWLSDILIDGNLEFQQQLKKTAESDPKATLDAVHHNVPGLLRRSIY